MLCSPQRSAEREASAAQVRDLKAHVEQQDALLHSANARLAQLEELYLSAQRERETAVARLEGDAARLGEELRTERSAREEAERDLQTRLEEAYAAHEQSTQRAAEIMQTQGTPTAGCNVENTGVPRASFSLAFGSDSVLFSLALRLAYEHRALLLLLPPSQSP